MTSSKLDLLERMYEALRSPFGVVVKTEDPERLRQKLYALRREHTDLLILSFVISPINPSTDLWIIRTKPHAQED